MAGPWEGHRIPRLSTLVAHQNRSYGFGRKWNQVGFRRIGGALLSEVYKGQGLVGTLICLFPVASGVTNAVYVLQLDGLGGESPVLNQAARSRDIIRRAQGFMPHLRCRPTRLRGYTAKRLQG